MRGGGAVSIIRDEPITTNLTDWAGTLIPAANRDQRAWFSATPICEQNILDGTTPKPECQTEVVDRYFDYRTGTGSVAFSRPRGVAIYPYAIIEFPRFGDRVFEQTPVTVRWRDGRVGAMRTIVSDLDNPDPVTGEPAPVNTRTYPADGPVDFTQQTATAEFSALFGDKPRQSGRRYRIELQLFTGSSPTPDNELSRTWIDVSYESSVGTIDPARLRIAPTIAALSLQSSNTLQLKTVFTPEGGPPMTAQDVTTTADTPGRATLR